MDTIVDLLEQSCRSFPAKSALRHKVDGVWQEISYQDLGSSSDRLADGLVRNGFSAGDHAALLAPSSPRWLITYLAILKAGGIVIPIDKELKSVELRHILGDSQVQLLFTDQPYLDGLLEMIAELPALRMIVTFQPLSLPAAARAGEVTALDGLLDEWREGTASPEPGAGRGARKRSLASQVDLLLNGVAASSQGRSAIQETADSRDALLERLARRGRLVGFDALLGNAAFSAIRRSSGDTAVIIYTSGTTGRAKGAMLSHANIVSNISGAVAHFGLDQTIHTLSFLPISHVFEQVCGILLPLSLGGTVSFCESLGKIGENLTEVKPTFFLGVPALYRMILNRIMKNIAARRLSRFCFSLPFTRPLITSKIKKSFGSGTVFISGGAALDPAIAEGLEKLGFMLYQGYGITETSPVIAAECPGQRRLGTVGRVIKDVEVRIDSPNDEQVGEILVRGPNVMQGYYRNPQATAEVLADGWYHSGDLGRMSDDGFLTICGRVKNLIVTPNGMNVYPEEVENELLKSPFIAEVVVHGQKAGPVAEEIHATIYPDQEALDDHARKQGKGALTLAEVESLLQAEVLAVCAGLAVYKRPRKISIRAEEFPKTTTRKIKRFELEASISLKD
jgi:long-chain acyl-CoA synthetase